MGIGDWNDGMSNIGDEGRGESVWLGWFLVRCPARFAGYAASGGRRERAERYRERAASC